MGLSSEEYIRRPTLPGDNVTKLFFFVTDASDEKARVFVSGKPLKPCHKFASKTSAYIKEERVSIRACFTITRKCDTRLLRLAR